MCGATGIERNGRKQNDKYNKSGKPSSGRNSINNFQLRLINLKIKGTENMSDPYEDKWEQYQNEHCGDCGHNPCPDGDYSQYDCCRICRDDMEEQERNRIEVARDAYWESKFMEGRGE